MTIRELWRCSMLISSFAIIALSGCNNEDITDLEQYIAEVKRRPKEPIPALPERKPLETFVYDSTDLRDPFEPIQPVDSENGEENPTAPDCKNKESISCKGPDRSRREEELEAFPLESLKMIGTVNVKSKLWALIKSASDNTVYRVQVGNYIGQDYGKIVQISPDKIDLMELVPNLQKPGTWQERQMSLTLSEDRGG